MALILAARILPAVTWPNSLQEAKRLVLRHAEDGCLSVSADKQCREAELLRKENEELRYQLSQCVTSCKSWEEIRELLVIIRKLEERIEAVSEENERLRRELEKCRDRREQEEN